ncbi:MAG: S8 family serine peptidase, partial [Anaerolineales bacterium]|nr:S8 family serine peptidase [Anaerolineales bacterium]
ANGFDGTGQIVAVADTGLGNGSSHAGIVAGRIVAIHDWPGQAGAFALLCNTGTITHDGSRDVDSGHGTHVANSVLGSGNGSGIGRGIAPGAQLVFQSTEDYTTVIGAFCGLFGITNGYYLLGLPDPLGPLFQQAYNDGARIHSNSWGAGVAGEYTTNSRDVDAFMWDNEDILLVFAAGNDGEDVNLPNNAGDGEVDPDSIGAPGTAKNVLTVGASEAQRTDNYPCDSSLTYIPSGGSSSCNSQEGLNNIPTWAAFGFTTPPLSTDILADNSQQMAGFSSRGPTDDGRIKPDVVAPGSWILSGYSDLYQQQYDEPGGANPQNGAYQYDGYGFPYDDEYKYMGGTSMATPLVSGAAAVVRQYYANVFGTDASAALVKATLINSANDLLDENNDGANDNDYPIPNNHEG